MARERRTRHADAVRAWTQAQRERGAACAQDHARIVERQQARLTDLRARATPLLYYARWQSFQASFAERVAVMLRVRASCAM